MIHILKNVNTICMDAARRLQPRQKEHPLVPSKTHRSRQRVAECRVRLEPPPRAPREDVLDPNLRGQAHHTCNLGSDQANRKGIGRRWLEEDSPLEDGLYKGSFWPLVTLHPVGVHSFNHSKQVTVVHSSSIYRQQAAVRKDFPSFFPIGNSYKSKQIKPNNQSTVSATDQAANRPHVTPARPPSPLHEQDMTIWMCYRSHKVGTAKEAGPASSWSAQEAGGHNLLEGRLSGIAGLQCKVVVDDTKFQTAMLSAIVLAANTMAQSLALWLTAWLAAHCLSSCGICFKA